MVDIKSYGHHVVSVAKNDEEMAESIRQFFSGITESPSNKSLSIGVSGGSMINILLPIFTSLSDEILSKCWFFPLDERLVGIESEDSNVGAYLRQLPDKFHSRFLLAEEIDDAPLSATKFDESLKRIVSERAGGPDRVPVVDVAFLGLGPDGHTCSLFPGHPLLESTKFVEPIEDSPKPPPRRITVTLPLLNHTNHPAFIVTGAGKAEVLKKVIKENDQHFPPSRICPVEKTAKITWFLDEAAASQL